LTSDEALKQALDDIADDTLSFSALATWLKELRRRAETAAP
jgi:hypothetical protein